MDDESLIGIYLIIYDISILSQRLLPQQSPEWNSLGGAPKKVTELRDLDDLRQVVEHCYPTIGILRWCSYRSCDFWIQWGIVR